MKTLQDAVQVALDAGCDASVSKNKKATGEPMLVVGATVDSMYEQHLLAVCLASSAGEIEDADLIEFAEELAAEETWKANGLRLPVAA